MKRQTLKILKWSQNNKMELKRKEDKLIWSFKKWLSKKPQDFISIQNFHVFQFHFLSYITFPVFSFPFIPWFLISFHEMTSQDFIENHVIKFLLILMHFLSFHCFSLVSLHFRIFWFSNFISCHYISFPVFLFHFILWFQDFISLHDMKFFIHPWRDITSHDFNEDQFSKFGTISSQLMSSPLL